MGASNATRKLGEQGRPGNFPMAFTENP